MRFTHWLGSVVALGSLITASGAWAAEEKIPVKDVPKAVLDAVKAKFPGVEIKGAEKNEDEGKVTYEVAFTYQGSKYEVGAKPDGTITEVEKVIEIKDLPAAVTKALKAKYPDGKFEGAEEVNEDGKISYEVVVETAGDKEYEVVLDASGKILETEEIKEEKEEKK